MGAIIPAVKVNLAASGSVVLESPIIIEDKEVSRMTPQEYAQGLRELGFHNVEQGKVLNYNGNDLGVYFNHRQRDGFVCFTARRKCGYDFPSDLWILSPDGLGRKRDQKPEVTHYIPIAGLERQALESFRAFVD